LAPGERVILEGLTVGSELKSRRFPTILDSYLLSSGKGFLGVIYSTSMFDRSDCDCPVALIETVNFICLVLISQ
jgi:hypothetical protein